MKTPDPVIRKASETLREHGGFVLTDDFPADEFDCCMKEIGRVFWEDFKARALLAIDGAYSSPFIVSAFEEQILRMEYPYGK